MAFCSETISMLFYNVKIASYSFSFVPAHIFVTAHIYTFSPLTCMVHPPRGAYTEHNHVLPAT
jgi:hypothetical protein